MILTNELDPYYPTIPVNNLLPIAHPHLPPLTALVSVRVTIDAGFLSARLAGFLSRILSAPVLASIAFEYPFSRCFNIEADVLDSPRWADVDKWLARLTTHVKTMRSLTVVFTPWPEGSAKWKGC